MKLRASHLAGAANVLLIAAVLYAADRFTEISLTGKDLFPESITSLKDGTLIVGSSGQGSILRIKMYAVPVPK